MPAARKPRLLRLVEGARQFCPEPSGWTHYICWTAAKLVIVQRMPWPAFGNPDERCRDTRAKRFQISNINAYPSDDDDTRI
jgi:hypothetical protein